MTVKPAAVRRRVKPRHHLRRELPLHLMLLPGVVIVFIYMYIPLSGLIIAFEKFIPAKGLFGNQKWIGWDNFIYLYQLPGAISALRNTVIIAFWKIILHLLIPITVSILLNEIHSKRYRKCVQVLTTLPNFISWVLVYAIAICIFSTDGFINSFLTNVMHVSGANTNYLQIADHTWLKMLLWGTWKGVGWSAIVYIAGIAGIDQQLYEAAKVDGANRFRCIWHITIPGLIPTYMVMLLMSIAGILSNGMEQYLVFSNAMNKDVIEVLDLYVYNIGIGQNRISLSTVVGISKSLIGITLLFAANGISKAIRGESII